MAFQASLIANVTLSAMAICRDCRGGWGLFSWLSEQGCSQKQGNRDRDGSMLVLRGRH
jgi:hypothetical protein